ncbi:MAG: hypothetical protein AAGB06_05550 [Verrucomicrobiota bacterium]
MENTFRSKHLSEARHQKRIFEKVFNPKMRKERVRLEREAFLKLSPAKRRESVRKANTQLFFHVAAICGFFIAVGCADRNPVHDWDTYTFSDSGFAVEMPGTPIQSVSQLRTQSGLVPVKQYQHKSIAFIYYVSVADFPLELIESQSKRRTLDVMMEDQILGMNGALLESSHRSFEGFPSVFFSAKLPKDGAELRNDNTLTSVIVVKGNRIYRASAIGLGNQEERTRFLGSFRLL